MGNGKKELQMNNDFQKSLLDSNAVFAALIELKAASDRNSTRNAIMASPKGRGAGSNTPAPKWDKPSTNMGIKKPKKKAKGAPTSGGVKKRIIRTREGAKRYGGAIGDTIGKAKIKKGETLSELALKYYGDANKWKLIAKASGIKDERKIPVGTNLIFPPDPDKKGKGKTTGNLSKPSKGRGTRKGTGKEKVNTREEDIAADNNTYSDADAVSLDATYYVQKGDDLKKIAEKYYGNSVSAQKIKDIMKANGLNSEKDVGEGQQLILPNLKPEDIYDDPKAKEAQKEKANKETMSRAPGKSRTGGKRKQASNGYVYYSDGAIYGPNGWVQRSKQGDKKKGSSSSGKKKTDDQKRAEVKKPGTSKKEPVRKRVATPAKKRTSSSTRKRASAAGSAPGRNSVK